MKDKEVIITKEVRNLISMTFREKVIEFQVLIQLINTYIKQNERLPKLHPFKKFKAGLHAYKYSV